MTTENWFDVYFRAAQHTESYYDIPKPN